MKENPIILITGASGFIGSNLVPVFKKNYRVITTDLIDRFDIRDKGKIDQLPKVDIVIHLAGIINIPLSWKNPQEVLEVNTIGTVNILEYCVKNNSKIIFPSSYPYGIPNYLPTDETHPISAENPYAVSKLAAESLCEVYQKRYGFGVVIMRIFNVYGPNQSEDMVIPKIILGLIKNGKVEVFSGKPKRDMVYISDVVQAFRAVLKKDEGFNIYNVGSGKNYSIEQISKKVIKISGNNALFIDQNQERPNEIMETQADIKKIRDELGWQPKVSIDTGLKKTYWSLIHSQKGIK